MSAAPDRPRRVFTAFQADHLGSMMGLAYGHPSVAGGKRGADSDGSAAPGGPQLLRFVLSF